MAHLSKAAISAALRRVFYGPYDEPFMVLHYGRVSSVDQVGGTGLDDRREAVEEWCEERNIIIAEYYADEGKSGGTDQRPEFQRMLYDLPAWIARGVQGVVTWALDRYARDVMIQLQGIDTLTNAGAVFISVCEQADYSTASGRKKIIDDANAAENWRLKHVENMTRAYRHTAIKKQRWVGPPPTGYERLDRRSHLTPSKDRYAIETLFALLESDMYSTNDVALELRRMGFPGVWNPQKQAYTPWHKDSVNDIAHNRCFIGEIRYHGEWHPGGHEPIIDKAQFERVQEILNSRGHKRGKTTIREGLAITTGISYCAECGGRLWQDYRNDRGHTIFICANRRKQNGCTAQQIPASRIDGLVLQLVEYLVIPADIQAEVIAELEARHQQRIKSAPPQPTVDPEQIARKLERLNDLYIDAEIDKEEYLNRKVALETQVRAAPIPSQVRPVLDFGRIVDHLNGIAATFRAAPLARQRGLLKQVFVAIWGNEKGITAIQPRDALMPFIAAKWAAIGELGGPGGVSTARTLQILPRLHRSFNTPYPLAAAR